MDELIRRIKNFSFKGILVILLVFVAISTILFIELSGIKTIRYDRKLELLPSDKIFTKEEVCDTLPQTVLLLTDSSNRFTYEVYQEFEVILDDMKVGHAVCDVANDPIPSFEDYSAAIVLMSDLTPMGDSILDLCDWVRSGASAWFPMTLETNAHSSAISQIIGINSIADDYLTVESIYLEDSFMVGGGRAYSINDPFDSSRTVILNSDITTVYACAEKSGGMPLVWRTEYGDGIFVVNNIGIYDKAMRGFYAASYSLLYDVGIYPVINASVYYLDDFPSQIPSGSSEYIQRDYQTTIREFYINIWWPDMMNFADRYGLKYTGLAIEAYDDMVDGTTHNSFDTSTFLSFGNMLLRKGGELGYHGYNHQPLALGNSDYKGVYDYKTWLSVEAMKKAFDELVYLCAELFEDTEFMLYVPPSNLLSNEGREFLLNTYPHIKTISGIYFEDEGDDLDFACVQEFDVNKKGVVDQPRVISGFILDEFMSIASISELNFHFINSHFTHPDDALDPERGAELGWEEMKRRFEEFLSWLYGSAPELRNLTGTETSAAVQRYVAVSHTMEETDRGVEIKINNFYDEAQFFIRFNEKVPDSIEGGKLSHLTGGLYLLSAEQDTVAITLK